MRTGIKVSKVAAAWHGEADGMMGSGGSAWALTAAPHRFVQLQGVAFPDPLPALCFCHQGRLQLLLGCH
jgi:hypothetical protein